MEAHHLNVCTRSFYYKLTEQSSTHSENIDSAKKIAVKIYAMENLKSTWKMELSFERLNQNTIGK